MIRRHMMTYQKIGPIEIITGENKSKVPFSTSLLIHGQDGTALFDCGAGNQANDYIKKQASPKNIYLTHYHLDHIWGVSHFPEAQLWINPYDKTKLHDLLEIMKANGRYAISGKEKINNWIEDVKNGRINSNEPSWDMTLNRNMNIYPYDQPLDVVGEKVIMIHAPGHSEGLALPYFPDYGVLFIVDHDLSSFGPWYNNADCDIDLFIESALNTLDVDAEYYVTSHHKGTVHRKDYERKLRDFLAIIERRESTIINAVKQGVSPKDIVYEEAFYFKETHEKNPFSMNSEKLGIAKHLARLSKQDPNWLEYYDAFLKAHNILKDYVDYTSDPLPADPHPLITQGTVQKL